MRKTILFSAILAIGMIACKDKDKNDESPKPSLSTRQQAMIGKDWVLEAFLFNDKDVSFTIPACAKDDYMRLTDAENGFNDEGKVSCDTTQPAKTNFKWRMFNNENKLEMGDAEGKDTFDIISVSATQIKLKMDESTFIFKNK